MEGWHFSLLRLLVGSSFMFVAAAKDIKTRRVPNELWMVMSTIAGIILAVQLFLKGVGWRYYLIYVPIMSIMVEAFVERPPLYTEEEVNYYMIGWFALPFVVFGYQIYSLGGQRFFWSLATIPIVMVIAILLYFFRILYGGADAKAVIVLAMLVPFYPTIPNLTLMGSSGPLLNVMEIFFPFTLIVLLNSSLLMVFLPIAFVTINLINGDHSFPEIFFGYRKKLEEIPDSFVWPMEYYEDGELKTELMPRGSSDERIESLKESGKEKFWVTPKLPFIVPMAAGFVISFVIGNPVMYLF